MKLQLHTDAFLFLNEVRPFLEARESESSFLLGSLEQLAKGPTDAFMAVVWDTEIVGARTLAVAFYLKLNLVIALADSVDAGASLPLIAQSLQEEGIDPPGVVGTVSAVDAFSKIWSVTRPCTGKLAVNQRLYELTKVVVPAEISVQISEGRCRLMTVADISVATDWILEFHREALPFEPYTREEARLNAKVRVTEDRTFLWETDGAPVSMASLARPTRNTVTINGVYTPPAHRRHGYAMNLVAAVSQEGLNRGKKFCVLYTDLANPASNLIYQKIGYRVVCDSKNVQFFY